MLSRNYELAPELRERIYKAVGDKTPYTELLNLYANEYGVTKETVACAVDYNVYHRYVEKFRIHNKTYLKRNESLSTDRASFR